MPKPAAIHGVGAEANDIVASFHGRELGQQLHGLGLLLKPDLPEASDGILPIDLTERIDAVTFGIKPGGDAGGSGGGSPGTGGLMTGFTSSVAGSAFNIHIDFKGTWTAALQQVFVDAANRISAIIVGDIANVTVRGPGGIQQVDDINITAELKAIDGVGNILGQAGPTSVRTGSYLPATASMQFDSADAANYLSQGLFDEIVTHEMLHSVGFGSIWGYKNLVSGSSFVGASAIQAYNQLLAAVGAAPASGVPLETGGGSGTAGSHWSEAVFGHELMTGYLNTAPDPLSALTAASLGDLGYQVKLAGNAAIDAYALA